MTTLSPIEMLGCNLQRMNLVVAESNSHDTTREQFEQLRLKKCGKHDYRESEMLYESVEIIKLPETISPNRILRLTKLRSALRRRLQKKYLEDPTDIFAVLDFDIARVSKPEFLVSTLATFLEKRYTLLCAHGRGLSDYYYDTFATYLKNGTYLYPKSLRFNKELGEEEVNWWDEDNTLLGFSQMLEDQPLMVFPVRSCFGGLSFYNSSRYVDAACSYRDTSFLPLGERFVTADNSSCEHMNLNLCMCDYNQSDCGIAKQLETLWVHSSIVLIFIYFLKNCM
eukprot:TRINITY_DN6094_c0_g1_i1.p1 TRINITY_DN6094_c0_g1~~TRINITY_DN6094_c0_g1_i1.p1  ORF type:complete len:282 (-),score=24.55 TRINITY_DN6094_c0_g1_i1:160-1005(-)